jgi:hypothetical protein
MKLPEDVREFFRQQGALGGKKRAENLSPGQRQEGARKAVQARWAKRKVSRTVKSRKIERPSK